MMGTLINAITVVLGGLFGIIIGKRLPEHLRNTVVVALGLFTLAFGLQMFLTTQNSLIVLGSLLIGVILGEAIRIEAGLEWIGRVLEHRLTGTNGGSESRFLRGFLTASLLFCVGPVAVLGSIQDGLTGNFQTLAVKSVLDGFASLAFASTLGVGVIFSAVVILVYQGAISLLARQVEAFVSTAMITEMQAVGGVILIGIAISSILEIKKIRVGSFLPALFIAPLIVAVMELF